MFSSFQSLVAVAFVALTSAAMTSGGIAEVFSSPSFGGHTHRRMQGVTTTVTGVNTPRSIYVDVLDYGATGDNKTDNTAAFQAAIAAAVQQNIEEVGACMF